MGLDERIKLYGAVESLRKHPLIVYVTSKRTGVPAEMASDALPFLIDQLDRLPQDTKAIDFLISSRGGDPMVAWRIMSLIRERIENVDVSVLVPHSAFSAATLLALGANQIVMHPNGHLGPVDMQITTFTESMSRQFSTEDIGAFIEFVRDTLGITEQEHLSKLFEKTCQEVGTTGVGFTARSQKLALALGEKLLKMHPPNNERAIGANAAHDLIEKLKGQFHSHAYPLSRKEALEIGLPVEQNRNSDLERLVWEIWLDLEAELKEREGFYPLIEVLRSNEAANVLLSDVPFMPLPSNAPSPTYMQADVQTVLAATKGVPAVGFEYTTALLESDRLVDCCMTKGKILSTRGPDMTIQCNSVSTFKGWIRRHG
jgi:hypothetical protein